MTVKLIPTIKVERERARGMEEMGVVPCGQSTRIGREHEREREREREVDEISPGLRAGGLQCVHYGGGGPFVPSVRQLSSFA